jgi:hypothetical protein
MNIKRTREICSGTTHVAYRRPRDHSLKPTTLSTNRKRATVALVDSVVFILISRPSPTSPGYVEEIS